MCRETTRHFTHGNRRKWLDSTVEEAIKLYLKGTENQQGNGINLGFSETEMNSETR